MPRMTLGLWVRGGMIVFLLALVAGQEDPLSEIIGTPVPKFSGNSIVSQSKTITPMHKTLLTQRGYIQFLRWELPVPEIEQFTFCVWVKSTNLTYQHSIFSYSKDEKERLVRAWISPYGKSIHLEINNIEMFSHPTQIEENRWYHICESWDNRDARYGLWINGQKEIDGYASEMAGQVIPDKGDIVLGQEYTDFDKGLEEGIEGAVLGFNLILASAFDSPLAYFERNKLEDDGPNGEASARGFATGTPKPFYSFPSYGRPVSAHPVFDKIPLASLGYPDSSLIDRIPSNLDSRVIGVREITNGEIRTKRKSRLIGRLGIQNSQVTPLGQQLIDTSFTNCQQGRGSPRIGGNLMLISWTRSPVRVFGGAIIKNAKNDCGQF